MFLYCKWLVGIYWDTLEGWLLKDVRKNLFVCYCVFPWSEDAGVNWFGSVAGTVWSQWNGIICLHWPFQGCGGAYGLCSRSRAQRPRANCLPRFILLGSFSDTLLVVSILDSLWLAFVDSLWLAFVGGFSVLGGGGGY